MSFKVNFVAALFLILVNCGGTERLKAEYEFNQLQPVYETKVTPISGVKSTLTKNAAMQLCELSGRDAEFGRTIEAAATLKKTRTSCRGRRNDRLSLPTIYSPNSAELDSDASVRCTEEIDVPLGVNSNAQLTGQLEYRQCLLSQGFATETYCVKNCNIEDDTNIAGFWEYNAVCLVGPSKGAVTVAATNQAGIYSVRLKRFLGLEAIGSGKLSGNSFVANLVWKINGVPLNLDLKLMDGSYVMTGRSSECGTFNLIKKS